MTTAWAPSPSSPARWRSARGCARPSPRSRPRSWTWTWPRIRVVDGDTAQTPDEGITAGSQSMETSGAAVRQAAAEARHHLLALAHEALEATGPRDVLTVDDGVVTDPVSGRQVDYWTIFGGQRFGVDVTGAGRPKPVSEYRAVGQAAAIGSAGQGQRCAQLCPGFGAAPHGAWARGAPAQLSRTLWPRWIQNLWRP
ncbi:MAG: molybdopterin cofactor-binding domain-containing protein [Caldilineaceae bacterium]